MKPSLLTLLYRFRLLILCMGVCMYFCFVLCARVCVCLYVDFVWYRFSFPFRIRFLFMLTTLSTSTLLLFVLLDTLLKVPYTHTHTHTHTHIKRQLIFSIHLFTRPFFVSLRRLLSFDANCSPNIETQGLNVKRMMGVGESGVWGGDETPQDEKIELQAVCVWLKTCVLRWWHTHVDKPFYRFCSSDSGCHILDMPTYPLSLSAFWFIFRPITNGPFTHFRKVPCGAPKWLCVCSHYLRLLRCFTLAIRRLMWCGIVALAVA